MIDLIKKNYYFLLIFPILINFLTNFNDGNYKFEHLSFYDLISSLLIFLYFLILGFSFKSINKNMTITIGIISYLISFFVVEVIALLFYENMNLNITFIVTNFLWFAYYFFYLKNRLLLSGIILSYLIMYLFNSQNLNLMTINANLTMDVLNVFYPNTANIYENSYKYSVSNPVMLGYPQFMSYIDALIFKISFGLEKYRFILSSSFIFYWLTLLLFFELKTSKNNKIFICLFFTLLIMNSTWLQFLFTSSLMSERIAGYLLAGILITLFGADKASYFENSFIFFILSFVYYTKQFFSVIILILFLLFLFTKKYRNSSLFLLFSFIINEISYLTYFSDLPREHHIRQIDFLDTIADLFLLRDLNISNMFEILKNLYIDKPMTYLLIATLASYIYAAYTNRVNLELNLYFFAATLNIIFVFLLYISAWREMELESPIRYIYSFLVVYLLIISKSYKFQKESN